MLLSNGSFLQISKACETKLMNIFQLLLSLRRRPAVSSAAAAMVTRISITLLQRAGSHSRLAPRSPRREKGCCVGPPAPQQPARSLVMIKCKYLRKFNIYALPLFAKGGQTHLVPAEVLGCQAELLPSPGEWWLGKDRTHKRGGGWEKGKTGDSKITRRFTMSPAEFGGCCEVGTRAKMGNTMVRMTKRLTKEVNGKDKGKKKGGRVVNVHTVRCQITLRLEKIIC